MDIWHPLGMLVAGRRLCFQEHPEVGEKTAAWEGGCPGSWGVGGGEEIRTLLSPGTLDQQTSKKSLNQKQFPTKTDNVKMKGKLSDSE